MADDFYERLKGFEQFAQLSNPGHYTSAPADWFVVVTDVKNSTIAIDEGRYKEINLSGAAVIMSVLNVTNGIALPYAFGGDGATMLIPPGYMSIVLTALASVQAKVLSAFGLELRAGCIPVQALYEAGASLLVAKYYLSKDASQAAFQGNALALAESWLKKGIGSIMLPHIDESGEPDLQGLECRWEPIRSRHGKIVSLLVKVAPAYEKQAWEIYEGTLQNIEAIYPDHASSQPSNQAGMHLSFSLKALYRETLLRAGKSWDKRAAYLLNMLFSNAVGFASFITGKKLLGFDGKRYLRELVANSDSRKFDETLRMVLDSTTQQHEALERMLAARHANGQIVYGMHESPEALMTCLVFSLSGNHVHLVDGSDGGYALAAKQMKQQLAAL